jgi:pimeloyl-ACP methyl ester carboxylesterase
VSAPHTLTVEVNGHPCRVWRKGSGPKLGFLAGFGGLPRWMPFLDKLAEKRTLIVPSLPGFPGALGHTELDSHLDWILAVRQLLEKSELAGADLVGSSPGASFVAEIAAIFPDYVRRIALIAPWGLFEEQDPMTDPWGQRPDAVPGLMCADPERWKALVAVPEGTNSPEWPIEMVRAAEAAARAFWPLGNTRLARRLPLVHAPTLLVWGEQDRVVPRSYAATIAKAIRGRSETKVIAGAGHLAEHDKPDEVSQAILNWMA